MTCANSGGMRRRILRFAAWCLRLGGLAALIGALVVALAVYAVPFPEDRLTPQAFESTRVRDRHGRLLREALSDGNGRATWVSLAADGTGISPWVPQAFIAIEDHRFRDHPGVDVHGILRAARDNLAAGRIVAGGSTLTQQLVGLVLPDSRTFAGKLREAVWALRLERARSKDDILEQYLNRVPFGHGTFGIEAAARLYFNKPARALTLAESALMAGIPRAPTLNNPFTDPAQAIRRQHEVLARMRDLGLIDEATWRQAREEPLALAPRERQFAAPHFTTWVLAQTPGSGDVTTTLDGPLQAEVESVIAEVLPSLADKNVGQAAAVVLDNATGDILAWVGSRDFFASDEGQVDMVIGERQPGSTLKPFVYGLGLESGDTTATRLPDFPMFFETLTGDYHPRNYDRRFHGWVRLREALACSYNVPAVYEANRVGMTTLYDRLLALGFASLRNGAGYYGLGLALGNGEVRLLELANAYRTLAQDGVWRPVRSRPDSLAGPMGRAPGVRIMPTGVARLLTDILSDPVARAPSFGRHNALELPFPAAAKTGTSTDFTDNWTVGYTPAVTVAVWVGNFNGRPMEGVSGITGAGRIWHRVMRVAAAARPGGPFPEGGLVEASLCVEPDCEHTMVERFLPGTEPKDPANAAVALQPGDIPGTRRLRVAYPDNGDVFGLSVDVPGEFSRIRFRAEQGDRRPLADAHLVWELDGTAQNTVDGPTWFWPTSPGSHRVRVWPADAPERASGVVRFDVLPQTPAL